MRYASDPLFDRPELRAWEMPGSTVEFEFDRSRSVGNSEAAEWLQEMALAMLQQTVEDLRRGVKCDDAHAWIADDDEVWPLSFRNCCFILNLAVSDLREKMLAVA